MRTITLLEKDLGFETLSCEAALPLCSFHVDFSVVFVSIDASALELKMLSLFQIREICAIFG